MSLIKTNNVQNVIIELLILPEYSYNINIIDLTDSDPTICNLSLFIKGVKSSLNKINKLNNEMYISYFLSFFNKNNTTNEYNPQTLNIEDRKIEKISLIQFNRLRLNMITIRVIINGSNINQSDNNYIVDIILKIER